MKRKTSLKDRDIPAFQIELIGDRKDMVDVLRDAAIGLDIDRELTRQPSLFSWYLTIAEEATDKKRWAEKELNDTIEDVWAEVEAKAAVAEGRGPSIESKKHEVARDKRVRKAEEKLLRAQRLAGLLQGYIKVFEQRGGALQSLVKNRTAEMDRLDISSRGKSTRKNQSEE
jgi:hypothetical protein